MNDLEGKVVIVTGGGSGIGAAIVQRLGRERARVALFDINSEAGEAMASDCEGDVSFFQADITSFDAVELPRRSEKGRSRL